MRIGVAQATERFREMLDRVSSGEVVEVMRRGEVVAVIAPASPGRTVGVSFTDAVHAWRDAWAAASWTVDDPFAEVRDREPGRAAAVPMRAGPGPCGWTGRAQRSLAGSGLDRVAPAQAGMPARRTSAP